MMAMVDVSQGGFNKELGGITKEQRLDSAFKIARQAFRKTKLTIKDIEDAIERIREKAINLSSCE